MHPPAVRCCMLHEPKVRSIACPVVCASQLRAGPGIFQILEAQQHDPQSDAQMQGQAVCIRSWVYLFVYISKIINLKM